MLSSRSPIDELCSAHAILKRFRHLNGELEGHLKNLNQLFCSISCEDAFNQLCIRFEIPIAQKNRFHDGITSQAETAAKQIIDEIGISINQIGQLENLSDLSNREGKRKFSNIIELAKNFKTCEEKTISQKFIEIICEINSLTDHDIEELQKVIVAKRHQANRDSLNSAASYVGRYGIKIELLSQINSIDIESSNYLDSIGTFSYRDVENIKNVFSKDVRAQHPDLVDALVILIPQLDLGNTKSIYQKALLILNLNIFRIIKNCCDRYLGVRFWEEHAVDAPISNVIDLYSKARSSSSFALATVRFLPHDATILTSNCKNFVDSISRLTSTSHGGERALHTYGYAKGEGRLHMMRFAERMRVFNSVLSRDPKKETLTRLLVEKISCLLPYLKSFNHANYAEYRESILYFEVLCKFLNENDSDQNKSLSANFNRLIDYCLLPQKHSPLAARNETTIGIIRRHFSNLSKIGIVNLSEQDSGELFISINHELSNITSRRIKLAWTILGIEDVMKDVCKFIVPANSEQEKAGDPSSRIDALLSIKPVQKHINSAIRYINCLKEMVSVVNKLPNDQNIKSFLSKREKFIRDLVNNTLRKESDRKEAIKDFSSSRNLQDFKDKISRTFSLHLHGILKDIYTFKATVKIRGSEEDKLINEINSCLKEIKLYADLIFTENAQTELYILDPSKPRLYGRSYTIKKPLKNSHLLSYEKFSEYVSSPDANICSLLSNLNSLLEELQRISN